MISLAQSKSLSANGHPFKPLVERWLRLFGIAERVKYDRFGKWAEEASKFYDGNHDWMWKEQYARQSQTGGFLKDGVQTPTFQMSVNKAFEAVSIFGPAMYHKNPNVQVTTHETPEITPEAMGINQELFQSVDPALVPQLQQAAQQAYQQMLGSQQEKEAVLRTHGSIMQVYLNWLQQETDKKTYSRQAINEAIIKGCSGTWTDIYRPPGSKVKYPCSEYVSVDDILIDPDARYWKDVQWIARKRVEAVNVVEEKYGLPKGSIKGQMRSAGSQATEQSVRGSRRSTTDHMKDSGKSHDIIEYWEVYSKNGMGDQLRNEDGGSRLKHDYSGFGRYNYVVVAKGVPFPLNMPTWDMHLKTMDQLREQVEWSTPFWADPKCDGGWPWTRIYFYESPDQVWPISMFKPVIGELRFVNWCMSFLADKVAQSCTTYVGMLKEAGAEIQKQLNGVNTPFTVVEVSNITGKGRLSEIIDFLQTPDFPRDIWVMVSEVLDMIAKRTGLTDLVYGMTDNQIRSAPEADVKETATNIRPDDMASRVEDMLSAVAAKEMQTARWHCDGNDVEHVIGLPGRHIWEQQILTQDYDILVRDYKFRIEAGSARKPNKNARVAKLTEFGNVALPIMQEFAMIGQVDPLNNYMQDMALAMDLPDPERYGSFQPPPPPPEEQGPSKDEVAVQEKQMELAFQEMDHQQDLEHAEEKHDQEMDFAGEKNRLELTRIKQRPAPASNGNGAR